MYNVILIGGISYDYVGRPLGPYRLRTAAENAGYSLKVIDYAWAFSEDNLITLLEKLITSETKILGISAAWFDHVANTWSTQSFYNRIKKSFPQIIIVTGGTKINAQPLMFKNSHWFITGFSDIAFIKLLDYVYGKCKELKYWKENGVKIIKGDDHYPVTNMDDIETVFKKEDEFLSFQPIPLEVSRGCIFKCAFCTHPFLGKKNSEYIRSAENLASELSRNYELFGTYRYTISDDTFNDSYQKIDIVQKAVDLAGLPSFEFVSYIRPELIITKTEMLSKLLQLGLKGCHIGMESLNNEARKIIGKGMDVNRVLDVVKQLRNNGVRIYASFIVGLPGETEKEIYETSNFLIENKEKYFHSWGFNPLGLMKAASGEAYSIFEKNPKDYGFETKEIKTSMYLDWISDSGMTFTKAKEIANVCNNAANQHRQFGGWDVAQAWYFGISENQILTEPPNSLDLKSKMRSSSIERATRNYNQIIKRSKNTN